MHHAHGIPHGIRHLERHQQGLLLKVAGFKMILHKYVKAGAALIGLGIEAVAEFLAGFFHTCLGKKFWFHDILRVFWYYCIISRRKMQQRDEKRTRWNRIVQCVRFGVLRFSCRSAFPEADGTVHPGKRR